MVITDHAMPQMTGTLLAGGARTLKPGRPILPVSDHADMPAGTATTLLRLTKSFSLDDLADSVAKPGPG